MTAPFCEWWPLLAGLALGFRGSGAACDSKLGLSLSLEPLTVPGPKKLASRTTAPGAWVSRALLPVHLSRPSSPGWEVHQPLGPVSAAALWAQEHLRRSAGLWSALHTQVSMTLKQQEKRGASQLLFSLEMLLEVGSEHPLALLTELHYQEGLFSK